MSLTSLVGKVRIAVVGTGAIVAVVESPSHFVFGVNVHHALARARVKVRAAAASDAVSVSRASP